MENKGKDSVIGYLSTTPAGGCSFVGDQSSFYATVKKENREAGPMNPRGRRCRFRRAIHDAFLAFAEALDVKVETAVTL